MPPLLCVPQGLKRIIVQCGDDTAVKAVWHRNYGVTLTSGKVTAWADARGAGFGPTYSVGACPFDASGVYLAFAVNISAFTPTSAALDLSTTNSAVYVGSVPQGVTLDGLNIEDSPTQNRLASVSSGFHSGDWEAYMGAGGGADFYLGVTDTSEIVRLAIVQQTNNTGITCTYTGQVASHAVQTDAGATPNGTGNNLACLNTLSESNNSGEGPLLVRSVLYVKPALGAAALASLPLWASADAGIKIAA